MSSHKEKIANMIKLNSNTTSDRFFSPGYECNPYFGASSFYGEQSRLFNYKLDGWRRDAVYFVPAKYKAIGRQLQL